MHDAPSPAEILSAATLLVQNELIPALPPEQAFKARILANALALVGRQLAQEGTATAELHARLVTLVESDGDDEALRAMLAARIDEGAASIGDPVLVDYLWYSTLGKIAVDQPRYASFLAETSGGRR